MTNQFIESSDQQKNNWASEILNKVMMEIKFEKIFPQLQDHRLGTSPLDDHLYKLVRVTIASFIKIKIHNKIKNMNINSSKNIRTNLSRSIIVQNE